MEKLDEYVDALTGLPSKPGKPSRRQEDVHESLHDGLVDGGWDELVAQTHHTKPEVLEVNLQFWFYPCRCRSPIEKASRRLCDWAPQSSPKTIRFLGARTVAQRDLCRLLFATAKHESADGPQVEFAGTYLGIMSSGPFWDSVDKLHVDSHEDAETADSAV